MDERRLGGLAFSEQGRVRQYSPPGLAFTLRVWQSREIEILDDTSNRVRLDLPHRRVFLLLLQGRRFNLTSSSEVRGGDHQRAAFAFSGHLQAQQVAPAGQITDRVALDRIPPSLVHQRGEWDEDE